MQIDVRDIDDDDVVIDQIYFGDDEWLDLGVDSEVFRVKSDGKSVPIFKASIPNMIKALEKALELWKD